MELFGDNFVINYENNTKGSFLIIEMEGKQELQEIQIEQLINNPFPGILRFSVAKKDDRIYIYYNITSKVNLEQYLKRNRIGKRELIGIIQDVARTLIKTQNYLLYNKNLIIDKRYIYLNPCTMEVFLAYLPVYTENEAIYDYKVFIKDLIMKSADIEDVDDDNYIQRILNYLKSDNFSLYEFNNLLTDLKNYKNEIEDDSNKVLYDIKIENKSGNEIESEDLFNNIFRKLIRGKKIKKTLNKVDIHETSKKRKIKSLNLNIDDTVFLNSGSKNFPLLKSLADSPSEEIIICKENFLIGRFKPDVDYALDSKYIGKTHAEIVSRNKIHFIKDLNSKNGTFVNGIRIRSNIEYEIKNGDRIKFAEDQYIFFEDGWNSQNRVSEWKSQGSLAD